MSGEPAPDDAGYDIVPPNAASLSESLRAFSYSLPTAIADLVDNSITAKARHVWIEFNWDGADSTISLLDDGAGMTQQQLVQAMRLGTRSPAEKRTPEDLGRFGLGLKTASFSQCRRVTVVTNTGMGGLTTRCWDLDYIAQNNEWRLLRSVDSAAESHITRCTDFAHGTLVLWQKLDRLVENQRTENDRDQQVFLRCADDVRRYLATVFHQIVLDGDIELFINGNRIQPWDPYLASEIATQALPVTRIKFKGHTVEVQPFILPHHSKLSKQQFEVAAGIKGWNAHQGFYVYRNRRLLVAGDWLGFGWTKEEHYKLARIRVEIPNALDHDWSIDVTKSRAIPPQGIRGEMKCIGERTRSDAKRVYSFRGARLAPQADAERLLLWEPMAKHDKTLYRLNRKHPLLQRALDSTLNRPALNALLRLIEETVPLPHIAITNTERPESLSGPFEGSPDSQTREVMEQAFLSLTASGYAASDAINRLKTIWPFELYPALLEAIAEKYCDV